MKRTVFIVVLLVLSIGIPVLAESNDSLSTESENPVLQKQELKLPWYKNMNYTLGYNSDSSLLTSGSSSKDTLKGKGIPFWRKLDYGIGYSGGLCWTGEDLAKSFEASPIAGPFILPMYFVAHLYYLNSIEVSATYPLKEGKGIEVGIGYGWARINPSEYVDWRFRIPILFLGYKLSKLSIKGRYMFIYAKDNIQSSIEEQHGRGTGNGLSVLLEYSINKYTGILLSLGNGKYRARRYYKEDYQDRVSEYNVDICFNAIGLSLSYKFNLKGGGK